MTGTILVDALGGVFWKIAPMSGYVGTVLRTDGGYTTDQLSGQFATVEEAARALIDTFAVVQIEKWEVHSLFAK